MQAVNIHLLGDWQSMVMEYLADLQAALKSLSATPPRDEARQEVFVLIAQKYAGLSN